MRGLLVTGTDTEVGKSLVAAGLCAWLRSSGRAVIPFKPVESGVMDSGGVPLDASLLAACAGVPFEAGVTNVYALPEPLAPVVAAERASVSLTMGPIDAAWEALSSDAFAVVEGVGGALVEVVPGVVVADLPRRWSLPTLVVAANRLGVLSHTLLTVEALQHRGAEILGVVLNTVSEGPPSLAAQTNEAELARLLPKGAPLVGTVDWLLPDRRTDPSALASAVSGWASHLPLSGSAGT